MLTARPASVGSWSFQIEDRDRQEVAAVDLRRLKDEGTVRVGAVPFTIDKDGWLSRSWTLSFEGVEVARAQRTGALGLHHHVRIAAGLLGTDTPLDLTLRSSLGRRRIAVWTGTREVGEIRRRGVFRRWAEIDVSEVLPLGVQAFLLALVLIEWRRAARSSS